MKIRTNRHKQKPFTIAIAGGTKGIGATVAMCVASPASTIVLGYYQDDSCANETGNRVQQQGGTPLLVKADLSTKDGVAEFALAVCSTGQEVLAIINCVSIHLPTHATLEDHLTSMQRHISVAVRCGESLGPNMYKQGYGHIISLTSTAASLPIATPHVRFYAAAKAAVESYTKTLASQLAPRVLVNAVAPGLIVSERDIPKIGVRTCYPEQAIPLGRRGTGIEVAKLISWLIFENTYMTGQTFVVDGGLTTCLPLSHLIKSTNHSRKNLS
jgi:3-oxoacyl-[acyl-carrier protein] reductase